MIEVGVLGAGGRMGSAACRAVAEADGLELVAAIDPHHAGIDLQQLGVSGTGLQLAAKPDALLFAGARVVIDFTRIEAARDNLRWAAENGLHMVVGTTGFTPDDIAEFTELFGQSEGNVLIAPNFSIGALLMMRFSELAAPYFETVEIVELHHDGKRDAPSGTSMWTAERIANASSDWAEDPTVTAVIEGARGGVGPGGIRIHSVRLRGMMAHQEVLFGGEGQSLTIRHDSYDRACFMPGVLLAVRAVIERPGLTYGLEPLLDL